MRRTPAPPYHVAHVVSSLGLGGLETGLLNLLGALDRAEFRHSIICLREFGANAPRAEALGAAVQLVQARPGRDRGLFLRLSRHLRSLRPDLVHSRNFGTLDAVPAARLAGVRATVHGEHGFDTADPDGTDRRRRLLRGLLSPLVRQYVCVSRHLTEWLLRHPGRFRGKVTTIINGVDTNRFSPRARGPDPSGFVVGTIGRLVPIKDQACLLRAFAAIADRHPGARLVIVGEGPLGPELAAQAALGAAAGRTAFPGAAEKPEDWYRRFDLFVLPSRNEGISNTILEAMASGLPVVATAVGGNGELVVDGETGRLVPRGDADALAEAIASYMEDREQARRHGEAGRTRAVAEFSIAGMAARYGEVYRRALGARRS
jgi:sugar transferase (PEP-CTERM/EpsH1 system associated)